jgi:hypothetical protein
MKKSKGIISKIPQLKQPSAKNRLLSTKNLRE